MMTTEEQRAKKAAYWQKYKVKRRVMQREARRRLRATPEGRKILKEQAKKYRKKKKLQCSPEKRRAHCKIRKMIKRGKLQRKPCEKCGNPNSQAHHDDYSKPRDVRWLCQFHHSELHSELHTQQSPESRANALVQVLAGGTGE